MPLKSWILAASAAVVLGAGFAGAEGTVAKPADTKATTTSKAADTKKADSKSAKTTPATTAPAADEPAIITLYGRGEKRVDESTAQKAHAKAKQSGKKMKQTNRPKPKRK